jgi:hypothetical protein
MVSLDQNDINNSKENLTQITTNPKHNQTNFYKNGTKNNLRFIVNDNKY